MGMARQRVLSRAKLPARCSNSDRSLGSLRRHFIASRVGRSPPWRPREDGAAGGVGPALPHVECCKMEAELACRAAHRLFRLRRTRDDGRVEPHFIGAQNTGREQT